MRVERLPIGDRASWLAMRQQDVTASVAGALLGVHEYTTAYALWAVKKGRVTEDPIESAPMRRGRLLEAVALQVLAEDRPTWTITPANDAYFRAPDLRIGATPDAYAKDPRRPGRGVVQIKSVEASAFRHKWQDPETGEVEAPLWIAIQAIIEAKLTGCEWAIVAPLVVGFGLEVLPVEIPVHDGVFERVVDEVRDFWDLVDSDRDPEPDYGRDAAMIEAVYRQDNGTEIDLSTDNRLPELLARRERRKAYVRAAQGWISRADAEVKTKLGPHERGHVPGWRISWPLQERAGHYVHPSSSRVLRIKPAR